jgi:transposase
MSIVRELLRILCVGDMSYRQIAKICCVSHNTVRRYDRIRTKHQLTEEALNKFDDTQLEQFFDNRLKHVDSPKPLPNFEQIYSELKKRGVTLEILWQEYRAEHPDGYSYSYITHLYRRWLGKLDIAMRQTHRAGEKLFLDYSGKKLPITNRETGEVWLAEIFVAAMGASSKAYVEASRSQQVPDWIQSNVNALNYFGGAPSMVIPDNLKSAVIDHKKDKVKLNASFVDMARYYGLVIIPARPHKPKDKAKVEAAVWLAQIWILAALRKRTFYSLEEANEAIWELLQKYNNRPFQKLQGTRSELFEKIDKPALKPLPEQPYEFADWKLKVRVGRDYEVEYDQCWYMVPHQLVNQYIDIRATVKTVEVIHKHRRVASHARFHVPGQRSVVQEFMPASHRHHSDWSATRLLAWAQSVGDSAEKVFGLLLEKKSHPESGFRACVALVEEGKLYGLERLESAASMALQINSPTLTSIRSLLRTGRDKLGHPSFPPNDTSDPETLEPHENLRGAKYYK